MPLVLEGSDHARAISQDGEIGQRKRNYVVRFVYRNT